MVLFECCRCKNKLKKNNVTNHVFKCSSDGDGSEDDNVGASTVQLLCVDCGVKLTGNDYLTHSNCKSGVPVIDEQKEQQARVRSAWSNALREAIGSSSLVPELKKELEALKLEQAPQRQSKFKNYVSKLTKLRSDTSDEADVLAVFSAVQHDFKEQFAVKKPKTDKTAKSVKNVEGGEQAQGKKKNRKRKNGVSVSEATQKNVVSESSDAGDKDGAQAESKKKRRKRNRKQAGAAKGDSVSDTKDVGDKITKEVVVQAEGKKKKRNRKRGAAKNSATSEVGGKRSKSQDSD